MYVILIAYFIDFGISKLKDDMESVEMGTVSWTAPEVLVGSPYTEKSDMFSFGIGSTFVNSSLCHN